MLLTPTYHVFKMYNCHQGAELLDSYVETKEIGKDNWNVPNLTESVSVAADGKIHITMTNLSVEEDYEIEGLLADAEVLEVKGTVLTNKMNAHNTFDAPEVVKTEEFDGCKVVDNKLVFTIPACSVLHLEVTVK